MNKIVISGLILASFLTPSLSVLSAQTVDTPATYAQVNDLKTTLIALLTQLIAQLQSQINDLVAQQSITPIATPVATPVLGSVSNPYIYTPIVQLGGGHAYFTLPNDVSEAYISLYDCGAGCRSKLHAGINDFNGFNQYQSQSASDRANNISPKPQTYNWTINARSADTDFSTTTGSFLGSDAWVVKEQ